MTSLKDSVAKLNAALSSPPQDIIKILAPSGTLRAGINLSNFLLVSGEEENGDPVGVSPSLASVLGDVIGCDVEYIGFSSPGKVADAAKENAWDIGNIGADPARAKFISFTDAYCEIEATFIVREGSALEDFRQIDQPSVRIATKKRAAYTLWLERHIQQAELVQFDSIDASYDGFMDRGIDVLAGLRPRLLDDVERDDSLKLLPGRFMAVQQAIGTPKDRGDEVLEFLRGFVDHAKTSGLIAALIEHHGMTGRLSVAG